MYRAARGKVVIRRRESQEDYAVLDEEFGLYVPATVVQRETAQEGVAVSGLDPCWPYESLQPTVLYNRYAANEVDDEYVVVRREEVLGEIVGNHSSPIRCFGNYVLVRPLLLDNEVTPGGMYLPDTYRQARFDGYDPSTLAPINMGVGYVVATGKDARLAIPGDWVIFRYYRAIYQKFTQADGRRTEHVFVRDGGDTIYAVIAHEVMRREFGGRAEALATITYRGTAADCAAP